MSDNSTPASWVRPFVALAAFIGTWLGLEPEAAACETVTVCVDWTQIELEDGPFGDLVTGDRYDARGARVTVLRPYPEPAVGMFLDSEGCGTFDTQFASGHKMLIYSEAVLGFGASGKIRIQTFQSTQDKDQEVESFYEVDIPSIPDGWEVEVDVPADAEHRIGLLANATEVVHRLQNLPGTLLTSGYTLRVWVEPLRQNASAPLDGVAIGSAGNSQQASALRRKFILGHEIGHWIQERITGGFWDFNYDYGPDTSSPPLDPASTATGNAFDEACRFAVEYIDPIALQGPALSNPNRHGIRSAEYVSGAMPEGFGHFVAAVAYNDDLGSDADGEFRYYKNTDETELPSYATFEDPAGDNRVVSLLGGSGSPPGGADRWVELECAQDWDYPLQSATLDQEVSSEVDWLRLFWRFVTAPYSPQSSAPTFWDVVHLVTFTQTAGGYGWNGVDHVLWPTMRDAVADPASGLSSYSTRFESLSADHGVYNDGP